MREYEKLIEYLDNFTIDNNEIGEFDGGGDSGEFIFDRKINNEMEGILQNICNDRLGFNWFDGNVSTAGRVYYYSDTKTIEIDGNTEDNSNLYLDKTINFDFKLPDNFHFDSINLYYGNEERVVVRINITSGFITEEMKDWVKSVRDRLENILDNVYYPHIYYFDGNILKKDLSKLHYINLHVGENQTIKETINLLDED
jgi:hypothetical protein